MYLLVACRRANYNLKFIIIFSAAELVLEWSKLHSLFSWQFLPESDAKTFSDHITENLRTDYMEARMCRTGTTLHAGRDKVETCCHRRQDNLEKRRSEAVTISDLMKTLGDGRASLWLKLPKSAPFAGATKNSRSASVAGKPFAKSARASS